MWRYLVGAVAALLLAGAGMLLFGRDSRPAMALLPAPRMQAATPAPQAEVAVPEATDRTREQKRFDRYDKDRNGSVTRDEYLASRHKAFAKLDHNGDGMLSFDEWAAKSETKFASADADHSNALSPAEFATTAVKHKTRTARSPCAPTSSAPATADDDNG